MRKKILVCSILLVVLVCSIVAYIHYTHYVYKIETAMYFGACEFGNAKDLETILKARPGFLNIRDEDGDTGLQLAVSFNNKDTVATLLKHHADVNVVDSILHATPLHDAASQGKIEIARELIDAGAKINKRDDNDFMPLHNAILREDIRMVKLLVESGADVNATIFKPANVTPLRMAGDNKSIADYLRQHGAKKGKY